MSIAANEAMTSHRHGLCLGQQQLNFLGGAALTVGVKISARGDADVAAANDALLPQ